MIRNIHPGQLQAIPDKPAKVVLSLFDYSGNWSRPYKEAGYNVIQIDKKLGVDILTWDYKQIPKELVRILLIAVPCDDYALSGARWFAEKDQDGRTAASQLLVAKTKEIIDYFDCDFVIENPMSRIHKLNPWIGKPIFKFNPYDFGDSYQKMTWLWGKFNTPIKRPGTNKGNWMYTNLGGKSEQTKERRSNTDLGFAYAFFEANP